MAVSNDGAAYLSPRERLHIRTHELAEIADRSRGEVTQFDYEQAKRAVTGEAELDRQNAALDAARAPVVCMRSHRKQLPDHPLNEI